METVDSTLVEKKVRFAKALILVNRLKIGLKGFCKWVFSPVRKACKWLVRVLEKPKNQLLTGGVFAGGAYAIGAVMHAHTKTVMTTVIQAGVSHTFPVLVTTLPTWLYWVGFLSLITLMYLGIFLLILGACTLITEWWMNRKQKNFDTQTGNPLEYVYSFMVPCEPAR